MNVLTEKLGRTPKTIAILRALNFGDLMCAIPAWRALRTEFPNTHITLISLPWAQDFVNRFNNYFDEYIPFPGFPGLPEQPINFKNIDRFLHKMQERKFDVLLQMHGMGSFTNSLSILLGSRITAGFCPPRDLGYRPDPELFLKYPESEHEVIRHIRLMEFLKIPVASNDLEFPLKKGEQQKVNKLMKHLKLKQNRYVCIHPGARDPRRRWNVEYFAKVARIVTERDYTIVLTGTEQEREITLRLKKILRKKMVDLSGKTDVGTLAGILKYSRLLVTNDTGTSHLAAALQVSSIVIFSEFSDPDRWAPLNRTLHQAIPWYKATPEYVMRVVEKTLSPKEQTIFKQQPMRGFL